MIRCAHYHHCLLTLDRSVLGYYFVSVAELLGFTLLFNALNLGLHDLNVLFEFPVLFFDHRVKDQESICMLTQHLLQRADSVLVQLLAMMFVEVFLMPKTLHIAALSVDDAGENVVGYNLGLDSFNFDF